MKKEEKKSKTLKYTIIFGITVFIGILGFALYNNSGNKYLNNTQNSLCSKGWYYSYLYRKCDLCPKGQYCPDGNRNKACSSVRPGTTTQGRGSKSENDCNICITSSKWYNGSSCVSCTAPYYCEGGQRKTCKQGYTVKKNGATSSNDCVKVGCKQSEYINSSGNCEICPKDYYCDGVKATKCFTSRSTKGTGSTSQSDCICANGTYDSGHYCITCPDNYYCQNGTKYKCPEGTVTKGTGKSKPSDCVSKPVTSCKYGYYLQNGNCYPCEAGHYCKDSKMYSCPDGQYQSQKGQGVCNTCPSGQLPSSDKKSCVKKCADGTYLNGNNCEKCPVGHYCKNNVKTLCAREYYQNKTGQSSCKKCNTGKIGTKDRTKCVCDEGTFPSGNKCASCTTGSYCTGGKRIACPKGTYQDKKGQNYCKNCEYGKTTKGTGSKSKSACK